MNRHIFANFFIAGFRASGSGLNGLNTENLTHAELFTLIEEDYILFVESLPENYGVSLQDVETRFNNQNYALAL